MRQALSDYLANAGLSVGLGKAYSIFDDRATGASCIYFRALASGPATGGLGRYVALADLPQVKIATEAEAVMLSRYAFERETSNFNLYIGDDGGGDVHRLDEEG